MECKLSSTQFITPFTNCNLGCKGLPDSHRSHRHHESFIPDFNLRTTSASCTSKSNGIKRKAETSLPESEGQQLNLLVTDVKRNRQDGSCFGIGLHSFERNVAEIDAPNNNDMECDSSWNKQSLLPCLPSHDCHGSFADESTGTYLEETKTTASAGLVTYQSNALEQSHYVDRKECLRCLTGQGGHFSHILLTGYSNVSVSVPACSYPC